VAESCCVETPATEVASKTNVTATKRGPALPDVKSDSVRGVTPTAAEVTIGAIANDEMNAEGD
jgi:hypothetical protein